MNLQIEENALAARYDLAHDRRTIRDECLQSDLENACNAAQLVDHREDLIARRKIERDDETVTSLHLRT